MISLAVNTLYEQDLRDDFIMNEDKDLYEFIENDPVKAFYLGYNIKNWFDTLDSKKQYLYAKQLRHLPSEVSKYSKQVDFWTKKFSNEQVVDLMGLSEYILNNMFYDEELDEIKLAVFFGQLVSKNEAVQSNN